ncbi:hypothetical protein KC331_g4735 [Hortaea werneckii]|nr:hypothetical protein KC331_g4735 [Hortaea werneckii]KAI7707606.1 hypothetical protein KC353_g11543 [Hortaea werneckii]
MPFNWRLQLRLAITNFVVVFIGVLVMKILLTPIGAYFYPANTTDMTSDNGSLSGKGSPLDNINFSDDSASTVSPEITIGGTPIAATTDAFGRLPDGGKYVELVDKGYSPMHIDLTDGLGELYQVVETVDGQVVYNETFRGEDAEGQYYAATGNKTLHKRARTQWSAPPMHPMDIWARYCKGRKYVDLMLADIDRANYLISQTKGLGEDTTGQRWQRKDVVNAHVKAWSVMSSAIGQDSVASIFSPIKADLETLVVGTEDKVTKDGSWKVRRHVNMNIKPEGPSVAVVYRQDRMYADRNNHQVQPTHAEYSYVLNLLDGIIVAQSMYSPEKMRPFQEAMPKMEKWSDVTYRCWMTPRGSRESSLVNYRAADWAGYLPPFGHEVPPHWMQDVPFGKDFAGPMLKWLNYIVIQNIRSPPETHEAISYCMDGYTDLDGSLKYADGRVPLWNDELTFKIGSICYYALLALPNCRGIAWFLAQHKERLGSKAPFSVKLWWPTDQGQPVPSIDMPSLLWEIRDATDPELLQEKAEVDQEVDAAGMQPV